MIKNKTDKKQYAHEQFALGEIYYQKADIAKAIEHWSNIKRDDDNVCYAEAQFNLGAVFDDKGDTAKVIEYWGNIKRDYAKKTYARAQFNLGNLFRNIGEATKAIECWSDIERDDDKEVYAKAQFNLGYLFRNIGEAAKTIECWSNIERDDAKDAYARAQFYLGVFLDDNDERDEAIKHWENIEKNDDEKYYAKAQFILVKLLIYKNSKNTENFNFNDIIKDDNLSLYAYFESNYKNIYDKIIKNYKNNNDIILLFEKIDFIIKEVNILTNALILKPFTSFENKQNPERKVATYTSLRVAEKLIQSDKESFHLNMYNNMNDTTEGQVLFTLIDLQNEIAENNLYAFLTCFTFNHNSLNQFRLYGKTDNIEGSGVSFVVNCNMFNNQNSYNHISNNTTLAPYGEKEQNIIKDNKIPIFRCIYLDPEHNYLSVAQRNKYSFYLENKKSETNYKNYIKEIRKIEKAVTESLKKIKTQYDEIKTTEIGKQFKQDIDKLIEKILLPLRFLTKHASFEEEAECRILYIKDIKDPMVQYQDGRVYIPYAVSALDKNTDDNNDTYLKKIYLGPKVKATAKIGLKHLYDKKMQKELKVVESNLPLA